MILKLRKNNLKFLFLCAAFIFPSLALSNTFNSDNYQNIIITEEKDNISISANNVTFIDLLNSIERYNGTYFKGKNTIKNMTLSVNFNVSNWNNVFKRLFKNYSWISIIGDSGDMTVHILPKSNSSNGSMTPLPKSIPNESSEVKSNTGLTQNQLTRISNGALRSPLPIDLFSDKKILEFLIKFDIKSYEDLNNSQKAMKARSQARQELRKILR